MVILNTHQFNIALTILNKYAYEYSKIIESYKL